MKRAHGVDAEKRAEALRNKHQLMISAAMGPVGKLDENADWGAVKRAMGEVLRHDPDNLEATRLLMMSHFHVARQILEGGGPANDSLKRAAKDALEAARTCAQKIIANSDDAEMKKEAETISSQVRSVLGY